jgi:diazepam-binding inhibitor (GABA receptor modulating acyl-CoA-binding protein)
MADYDEKIYDDTLKATGDEALAKEFAIAYKSVKDLKSAPSDNEKLKLYGLSKQALQNPPFDQKPKPGAFAFKEKYMYQAWKDIFDANTTPADAAKEYIELVHALKEKYGVRDA